MTTSAPTVATPRTNSNVSSINSNTNNDHSINQKVGPPYSVVNIETSMSLTNQMSKKVCEAYDDPKDMTFDHDENKYQRKSAIEWFLRWWKLISRPPARRRNTTGSIHKRYVILIFVGVTAFCIILVLLSWLGRMSTEGDPSYNVLVNPHVKVQDDKFGM